MHLVLDALSQAEDRGRVTVRVIGLGQPAAGDDGVGHAVLDALSRTRLPEYVELERVREASALLPLLENVQRVIIVDAAIDAGPPGTVHILTRDQLDEAAMSAVSSHGVGVVQALTLAETLSGHLPEVWLVALSIAAPTSYRHGFSAEVTIAIPEAVTAVSRLLEDS